MNIWGILTRVVVVTLLISSVLAAVIQEYDRAAYMMAVACYLEITHVEENILRKLNERRADKTPA